MSIEALPFSTGSRLHHDQILTGEAHTVVESGRELRPHVDEQVVLVLQAVSPGLDGILDSPLELSPLHCIENIGEPLSIEAVPVALIWYVPESILRRFGEVQHVLNRQSLNLRHGGN